MAKLLREHKYEALTIASGANLSAAFDMKEYAMGLLQMPAVWTAASIGFQVSATQGGTFAPLYDDNGNLVQIDSPAVDNAYAFPAAVAGAAWVKLWSQDGAGSDTNQAAERSLTVELKS